MQIVSLKNKWLICRGQSFNDKNTVASVTKETLSIHGEIQVKLSGSKECHSTLRQKGIIAGKWEFDIMHKGQLIGQVSFALKVCSS